MHVLGRSVSVRRWITSYSGFPKLMCLQFSIAAGSAKKRHRQPVPQAHPAGEVPADDPVHAGCQERMDVVGLSVGSPGENFAVFPLLCRESVVHC
jgi:hypothetical protein